MDKLRALETFVRIVEDGSLTAAAAALGTSLPSVVRTLASLESDVGVRLAHRTTRRFSLTDEGREYYERCKRILADVEEADAVLSSRRVSPKGKLRVTASAMFGRLYVAPLAAAFAARHPEVELELLFLDRIVDLVEEGIDLGVRIARLPESSLVALPVGSTGRVVCASPGYLRRHGTPASPGELPSHRCVAFTGLGQGHEWHFGGAAPGKVAIRPVLSANQTDAVLDACLRGIGCAQFLSYQVRQPVADGKLRRVLREFEPEPVPIHLVYPHGRLLSANVRAFVDFAVPRLRRQCGGT